MPTEFAGYEPGDDICPPWWPGWWKHFKNWPPKPPVGFDKAEQVHLTLAIHQMATQLSDSKLCREIQGLTTQALKHQVEGMGR